MSEFVPLSEVDPAICSLPVPVGLEDRVGIHMKRLTSITALGCFASNKVRITSADGDLGKDAIGIAGQNNGAAYATHAASASASKTARHDIGEELHDTWRFYQSRMPASLTLTLNSTEIADRVKNQRSATDWAQHTDNALRAGLNQAIRKNLVTSVPTADEAKLGFLASFLMGNYMRTMYGGDPFSTFAGATLTWYQMGANLGALDQIVRKKTHWTEARLSLAPCFHVDRFAIAALRLKTSRLIKPLEEA